jgi:hypothetical protein
MNMQSCAIHIVIVLTINVPFSIAHHDKLIMKYIISYIFRQRGATFKEPL